jgi:hypothetical protein
MFIVHALGINGLLVPVIALVALAVVVLLVWKGKGPAMVGAILLVVPAPIYWTVLGALSGLASSYEVMYMTDVEPRPRDFYGGYAEILVSIQIGVLATVPVFMAAVGGLIYRAVTDSAAGTSVGK